MWGRLRSMWRSASVVNANSKCEESSTIMMKRLCSIPSISRLMFMVTPIDKHISPNGYAHNPRPCFVCFFFRINKVEIPTLHLYRVLHDLWKLKLIVDLLRLVTMSGSYSQFSLHKCSSPLRSTLLLILSKHYSVVITKYYLENSPIYWV